MSASAGVQLNLARASRNADRLARCLCLAGTAEPAAELSLKLVRMSDDARVLAGALERLALRDADAKDRARAAKERARWQEKNLRTARVSREVPASTAEVQATLNIASEAAAGAAEQSYFFNWAAPVIEDESEAELGIPVEVESV